MYLKSKMEKLEVRTNKKLLLAIPVSEYCSVSMHEQCTNYLTLWIIKLEQEC